MIAALQKVGYRSAEADSEALWALVSADNDSGKITSAEWAALESVEEGAKLPELCSAILEKFDDLEACYADWTSEESLTPDVFAAKAADCGYAGDSAKAFSALTKETELPLEQFQTLFLYYLVACTGPAVSTLQRWIGKNFESFTKFLYTLDPSGCISSESAWTKALAALGFADTAMASKVWKLIDVTKSGTVGQQQVDFLERIDGEKFAEGLAEFKESIQASTVMKIWEKPVTFSVFRHTYRGVFNKMEPMLLWALLGGGESITKERFQVLETFTSGECESPISRVQKFLQDKGLMAFNTLFAPLPVVSTADMERAAETKEFISWATDAQVAAALEDGRGGAEASSRPQSGGSSPSGRPSSPPDGSVPEADTKPKLPLLSRTVSCYKGRQWMQQFYNAVGDATRGKNTASSSSSSSSSKRWIHFFPRVGGDALPLSADVDTSSDPANAKVARWHHAEACLDLTSFAESGVFSGTLFLSRIASCPAECPAPDGVSPVCFEKRGTFLKFSLSFSRLQTLCPRPLSVASSIEDALFGVDPHPKAPQKRPEEDFDEAVVKALAYLGREYADFAHELGLETHGDEKVLGPLGWRDLLDRIEGDPERERKLMNSLRPALQKLVRSRVVTYGRERLPCAGLYGDERDAKYTDMSRELCALIFRTLNSEAQKYAWRRDSKLWKNPPNPYEAEHFWEPDELKKQLDLKDEQFQRLALEAEMYGDVARAGKLWRQRLALEKNLVNFEAWFHYSRFLLRGEKLQMEAEKALMYTISIKRSLDAATTDSLLLMSLLFLNRQDGSSESQEGALFFASECAKRSPTGFSSQFLLFLVHAFEHARGGDFEDRVSALKYLHLARAPRTFFRGALPDGETSFLALQKDEKVRAGEVFPEDAPAPEERTASHEDSSESAAVDKWTEEFPAFVAYDKVHALPDGADSRTVDIVDKILYLGVASVAKFILLDQEYGLLSEKTRDSEKVRLQLAKCYMLEDDWPAACNVLQQLLSEVTEQNCEAWAMLGECEYRQGAMSRAQDALEKALSFLPTDSPQPTDDPVLALRLGAIYLQAGKLDEAAEFVLKSLETLVTSEAWKILGGKEQMRKVW
ncbi:unnamed protein product [Amoebophrya sp. A25]|nr:unnamed protein product [Amoebophrya sp. A25]|eukprot:GSA25T00013103001.1